MKPIAFGRARTAASAVQTIAVRPNAMFVAGGTSLVDLMKEGVELPEALIDVNGLPLSAIEARADGLHLGALATNADVARHPAVVARFPVLAEALLSGASAQLRNMATVGGNLLQRTRCPYFRDVGFERCNKRAPGSGCGAIEGHHRNHAILGASDRCIATHPSDMAVALVALDAVVHVLGPHGERQIPLTAFHLAPGDRPDREHVLGHGELITAVTVPAAPWAARSHYLKVRDRASYEFALASAAVALEVEAGVIRQARIALGGVGTVPWRAYAAEAALVGQPPTEATFDEAARMELAQARPLAQNAFKVTLAARALVKALEAVAAKGVSA
ncbi:MAG: aromatic aldehyde oxidoreductase FAD-binding subunit [Cyanobacteria bacterium RYN_339]|nr:aromatic aldehyde oxidoreductase FAD-binding subunit [Cyanobacteria bacterium RYN_339]